MDKNNHFVPGILGNVMQLKDQGCHLEVGISRRFRNFYDGGLRKSRTKQIFYFSSTKPIN
jgi:hypothetical protein